MNTDENHFLSIEEYAAALEKALKVTREDFVIMLYTGRKDFPDILDFAGRFLVMPGTLTADQALRMVDAQYERKSDRVEHGVVNREGYLSLSQLEHRLRLLPIQTYRLAIKQDLPRLDLIGGRIYFPIANVEKWQRSKLVKIRRQRGALAWFAWLKSMVLR